MPRSPVRAVAVLLFILIVAAGCTSRPAEPANTPQDEAPVAPALDAASFVWKGENFSGSLALQLGLESAESVRCRGWFNITGDTPGRHPIVAVVQDAGGDDYSASTGTRQSGFVGDQYVQAHAAGAVHQHTPLDSVRWTAGANFAFDLEPGKRFNLTVAAIGLKPGAGERVEQGSQASLDALGNASASLWLSCPEPAQIVSFGGSKEVWLFDEAGLRGGVGAHAYGGLEVTGANVANKFTGRVVSSSGLFFVDIGADLLLNHVGVGVIQITHPGGSDLMVDRPRQVLVEVTAGLLVPRDWERMYRSGPGTYELTATYASVDVMGMLRGGLIGIAPLAHPDELLAKP